ncbi:very-short-patch-repair endonuclease [Paenibacillus sp. V4I9]|uniref:hypothetical protein n=1 Tax=Paenibacillus sp. V4I9 TaxID=3042308 RepID=UPI00277FEB7D|nr:hypothetical protein [Paenibacillus sp. V4I9]MDQ0888915.1 very-short-patch-repair endonuclease [Paenibacillus sp. V4I9]
MPTKEDLINAIAEVLAVKLKDYRIEQACNDLGLNPTDVNPSQSKRVYSRNRLYGKTADELLDIADKVLVDYGDTDEAVLELEVEAHLGGYGPVEQLIFGGNQKPDVYFDLVNNQLHIVDPKGNLVYDRRIIRNKGVYLEDLEDWWQHKNRNQIKLLNQMYQSLQSDPERLFYFTYYKKFQPLLGGKLPALIPQVHFNYDPKTIQQLSMQRRITQRMDFLMFLPRKRSIFEIDGIQHYSVSDPATNRNIANSRLYAQMVTEDRMYRLAGYEVFRFGGQEFINQTSAEQMVFDFFEKYFKENKIM